VHELHYFRTILLLSILKQVLKPLGRNDCRGNIFNALKLKGLKMMLEENLAIVPTDRVDYIR
jgi:hypothetical protein